MANGSVGPFSYGHPSAVKQRQQSLLDLLMISDQQSTVSTEQVTCTELRKWHLNNDSIWKTIESEISNVT